MSTSSSAEIREHNRKPAAVWSAGGAAYEEVSRSILDCIEHCAVRLAPRPGERILDIATGTGWAARRVARRGARVVGIDIAEDVVAAAREYARAESLDIDFRVADAEALPFRDGEFDGVLSTFGVMFATDPQAAARELARVCRPGGRIALSTWTTDGTVAGMFGVMKRYMPRPPSPPKTTPFSWGEQAFVESLLGEWFDLEWEEGESRYWVESGEDAWRTFVEGYGPLRTLVGNLDETQREALRADFAGFHDQYATGLGVTVPRTYRILRGIRK